MMGMKRAVGVIALALLLTASIVPPAQANPIANWLFGAGTKKVAEKAGYTCPSKPWYLPIPSYLWYDLTCAKQAH